MTDKYHYIGDDNQPHGPVSEEALRRLGNEQKALGRDLVYCKEGDTEWVGFNGTLGSIPQWQPQNQPTATTTTATSSSKSVFTGVDTGGIIGAIVGIILGVPGSYFFQSNVVQQKTGGIGNYTSSLSDILTARAQQNYGTVTNFIIAIVVFALIGGLVGGIIGHLGAKRK